MMEQASTQQRHGLSPSRSLWADGLKDRLGVANLSLTHQPGNRRPQSVSAKNRSGRMSSVKLRKAAVLTAFASGLSLALAACGTGSSPVQSVIADAPGAVELNQTPLNDVPLGGGGTGTVNFHGAIYHFATEGLGVEGSAIAILQTSGEVYRLGDIAGFSGTYRRATDTSFISGQATGGLWLQNEHATIIHLRVPPGGRMPDIGSDAVGVIVE